MLTQNEQIALFCTGANATSKHEPLAAQEQLKDQYQIDSVFAEDTYRYLPPKQRAEIFLDYLFDENIKALWAFRGGEGTADTLPYINRYQKKISQLTPKPIIGFSDITPLLVYFTQTYQWPTIHGPGGLQLTKNLLNKKSFNLLFSFLAGQLEAITFPNLKPLNQAATSNKVIHSTLTGGNLSLLNISIADIWEINSDNKILIIEEVNEKPHAVKRTLHYLQRLNKFKKVKAILLGDFSYSSNKTIQTGINKVLGYFAEEISAPVFKTDQFGHGRKNYLLPFGTKATLDCSQRSLIIKTSK